MNKWQRFSAKMKSYFVFLKKVDAEYWFARFILGIVIGLIIAGYTARLVSG